MKAGFYYGAVLAGILVGVASSPYLFQDYNPLTAPPSIFLVLLVSWFMRPALGGAE